MSAAGAVYEQLLAVVMCTGIRPPVHDAAANLWMSKQTMFVIILKYCICLVGICWLACCSWVCRLGSTDFSMVW